MKEFTKEELETYNALLYNIKVHTGNNTSYHIAKLKDFVDVMVVKQNGYCPEGYEIP